MDAHAINVYVAALRYAAAGYHVYPVTLGLKENGKKKVTVHVKWSEASTTDTAQITAWFGPGTPYAGAGIGIDCDKSGIVVVDLDEGVAEGGRVKAGIANWNELIGQHGGAEWEPFRVQTRSGGGHLFFRQRADAPVFNTAGKVAVDVDTRGVGGTVFAAPTRIQGTDQAYRWLADLIPVADLPLIPAWLPELLAQMDRVEEAEAVGALTASGQAPVTVGDARGRMMQHCDVIRAEPVGSETGNTTVYKRSCMVGQYVGAGQIDYADAHAALTAAVDSWQYTDPDLYKAIDRGLQWGLARPRAWEEAMAAPSPRPFPCADAVPALQAPQPAQHAPVALADAHAVFRRWLGPEYDMDALNATLAAAAVERLDGDPLWLLVISGSGNAKTETVQALSGTGATVTSTISSDGALLSASPRKDRGKDATGGLLRKMGDRGVLVIKDVTSILSANRDTRATVLAAMREVYDGHWERNVGTDGGRTLTWAGRLSVVGAVTTAWDQAHDVIATMGDRFVLLRMDSTQGRLASGRRAIGNTGDEVQMRAELAAAVGGVLAGVDPGSGATLTDAEQGRLLAAADVVTLARTAVVSDYRGDVVDAHAPEMPTRFAKQLSQVLRGALAMGMGRGDALRLALRCARDSMPPLRLAILLDVAANPLSRTTDVRKRLEKPRTTVDRQLQALHMLGLVHTTETETSPDKFVWRYSVTEGIDLNAIQ